MRHNKRLLLPGAYVLKEVWFVRLAVPALRASQQLASGRVARSRNASRYADTATELNGNVGEDSRVQADPGGERSGRCGSPAGAVASMGSGTMDMSFRWARLSRNSVRVAGAALGPHARGLHVGAALRRRGQRRSRPAALAPGVPHNTHLLLPVADVLKEVAVVRLGAHALRAKNWCRERAGRPQQKCTPLDGTGGTSAPRKHRHM